MSTLAYLAGVASMPAAILFWVAFKYVLHGAAKGVEVAAYRIPDSRRNRAGAGAIAFGAKRLWSLNFGEVALMLVVGLDDEQHGEAVEVLDPPIALESPWLANPTREEGR